MRAMTVTRKRCRVANLPNGTKAKGDSASPSLKRRSVRLPHANGVVDEKIAKLCQRLGWCVLMVAG